MRTLTYLLVCLATLAHARLLQAQDSAPLVFPDDAVIDVTKSPYFADATGVNDVSSIIQQAMDDYSGDWTTRFILYFPQGTYRFASPIQFDTHNPTGTVWNGGAGRAIIFQGAGKDLTTLKLDDNASGFGDANNPQVFVDFNESQEHTTAGKNVAFHAAIKDLTIDIGAGNPGAIGLDFVASNAGGLFKIKVQSSDPQYVGDVGIYMSTIPGPQLFKDVEIEGFNWGIEVESQTNYTSTIEFLSIRNSLLGGILNPTTFADNS